MSAIDLEVGAEVPESRLDKLFRKNRGKFKPSRENTPHFIRGSTEQRSFCSTKSNNVHMVTGAGNLRQQYKGSSLPDLLNKSESFKRRLRSRKALSHTPSPDDLLKAVVCNSTSIINELIARNKDFITCTYSLHDNKTIIQIAVSNIEKTISNDTIKLLIDHGADLHYKNESLDDQQALHIATVGQNSSILQTILDNMSKDRVNDVTSKNENALHLLIRKGEVDSERFWECLDILLENDININQEDENGNTPILIAVKKRYEGVIKKFYEWEKHFELDDLYRKNSVIINAFHQYLITLINHRMEDKFFGHPHFELLNIKHPIFENQTLLQMSCEKNLERIVEFLLLENVDVNEIGKINKETPLEIATNHGFYPIFKILLQETSCNPKIPDDILVTALQNAIYFPNLDCGHRQCLQYLLNQDKISCPVNVYKDGNTALHYAVQYSDCETIISLLKRGASLGNKNIKGIMPIDNIYPQTLERHLNNCIETTNNPSSDRQNMVVTFNYKTLLCSEESKEYGTRCLNDGEGNEFFSETDVFLSISNNPDLKHLLKHPVITAFLSLKWYKMKLFFNLNLLFYSIFFPSLIVYAFVENPDWLCSTFYYVLVSTFTILTLRELVEILFAPRTYATDPENYLELCLIVTTGHIIFASDKSELFNRQMLAISIILASIELMFLLGRYPFFSTYISVFKIVTWNFFKFMLWSSALFIGFTLGFFIIYHDPKADVNNTEETDFFTNPFLSFIKIIAMSAGELDASSFDLQTPLNKVFFLFFLFLATITLYNVLNGLAVSDIQTIKNNAEIISLVARINRITYFENMFMGDKPLLKFLRAIVRYMYCNKNHSKEQVPTWLAKRLFLFSSKEQKIEMLLFNKGKLSDDENSKRNTKNWRFSTDKIWDDENSKRGIKNWRLNKIYMDSNVVKSTKELVLTDLTSNKPILRQHLIDIRNNINNLVYFSSMTRSTYLDILAKLNAVELMVK